MQTNPDPSLQLASVIGAIPEHLKTRFNKEIAHAFATNLCVYDNSYVTHSVIHFTSAESPHVAEVVEDIKLELEANGWFTAVRQPDPQFIEVYLSSLRELVTPLNLSAFAEATGLDISDVHAPLPEAEIKPLGEPPHDHHVSGMEALELSERVCVILHTAFPQYLKSCDVVRTSPMGPHLLVESNTGETFGVWPAIDDGTPVFRFAMFAEGEPRDEIELRDYSQLVLHMADYVEPNKTRRFQLFQQLTRSTLIQARYSVVLRYNEIVLTERDETEKSVKYISEATDTASLFKVRIVSETGADEFMATAADMENLLLTH
jgi:hypothetical protein